MLLKIQGLHEPDLPVVAGGCRGMHPWLHGLEGRLHPSRSGSCV
jgi:hypothetical protein